MTILKINNTRLCLCDDSYATICIQSPDYFAKLKNVCHDGHHFGLEDSVLRNWGHPCCVHKDQLREFNNAQWVEVQDANENCLARYEFI